MAFIAVIWLLIQIVYEYLDSWFVYFRDRKKTEEFLRRLDEYMNKKP